MFQHKLVVTLVALVAAGSLPGVVAAREPASELDTVIASSRLRLANDEVANADITETTAGQERLEELARDGLPERPRRVFSFGEQVIIVDAATSLTVFSGENSAGDKVYEILPLARPAAFAPRAGFTSPPESAWVYNTDGDWTDIQRVCDGFGNNCQDAWKRQGFWNINAAWNQGGYQYFRMYGRQQTSAIFGTSYGWARTFLWFNNNLGWGGSPNEFEIPLPESEYHSPANTTITIGFKTGLTYTLGKAPISAGGSLETNYLGSVTLSYEYWHPITMTRIASGGVQYCRYDNNFKMTKVITARVGIRQNVNGALGGWYINRGTSAGTHDIFGNFHWPSECPGQS